MQPYSCTYNIESLQSDVAICYTNVIYKICQYFINLTEVNADGIKQIVQRGDSRYWTILFVQSV